MTTAQERIQKETEVTIKHLSKIISKATHPLVAISSAAEIFVSVLRSVHNFNPDAATVVWRGVTAEVSKMMEEDNSLDLPSGMTVVPSEVL